MHKYRTATHEGSFARLGAAYRPADARLASGEILDMKLAKNPC